jgi:hypothetical protein
MGGSADSLDSPLRQPAIKDALARRYGCYPDSASRTFCARPRGRRRDPSGHYALVGKKVRGAVTRARRP